MGYWDTPCLAKLYVDEADSSVLRSHVAHGAKIVTGEVTRMELWATLRRKEADGDLLEGMARNHLRTFDEDVAAGLIIVLPRDAAVALEFEGAIEQCYSADPQIYLRTLDAIHLASALISKESEMVTTDRRLREAARMFGLEVFPTDPHVTPAPSA
jgi:predicted nucleic acid-binding protein